MAHAGNFLSTVCLGALCGLCFAEATRQRPTTVVYTPAQPQPYVYVPANAPAVVVAKRVAAPLPALALEVPPPPPSDAIDRV